MHQDVKYDFAADMTEIRDSDRPLYGFISGNVKIWFECSQIASASGGISSFRPPTEASPLDPMWGHIDATWRIRLNRPSAAAMRPYVKLLWPLVIIRPHRSTTYVDAAYYYRPSVVVCRSVCRSVTVVSPAKTVEPIKMPFGLWAWVQDPRNYVLDGVHIPHGKGQF